LNRVNLALLSLGLACAVMLSGCSIASKASDVFSTEVDLPIGLTGATCSDAKSKVLAAHLEVKFAYQTFSIDGPCNVISVATKGDTVTLQASQMRNPKPTTTTTTLPPPPPPPPWYPADYTVRSDEIAYRWMTKGSYRCDSGSNCWGIEVIAHYGCSGIYAELSVMDSADRVIDYANDSIGAVRAGQHGILKPSFYSDGGSHTGRLASLTCN